MSAKRTSAEPALSGTSGYNRGALAHARAAVEALGSARLQVAAPGPDELPGFYRALLTEVFTQLAASQPADPLGDVYTALLGFAPRVLDGVFALEPLAGQERKARGSYYTPPPLVERLLDAALEPLLDRVTAGLAPRQAASALLAVRVCDPACGSGHLLLAAGRRLARRLAALRSGGEPSPEALRRAAAAVVERCLYGVDLDPIAVLLCRHALWQLARPGAPPGEALTAHVQAGDALRDEVFAWPERFPEVMGPGGPRFDVVLGNPPFLNAIEGLSARSAGFAAQARRAFQPFAQGAYDLCLLFWARTTLHLLNPGGVYGLFSPTALLSQGRPWQRWMHERWRPTELHLYPPRSFPGASVRVSAIIGAAGASPALRVRVEHESGEVFRSEGPWPEVHTWYEATVGEQGRGGQLKGGFLRLDRVATLQAGCATGAAYDLAPLVVDDLHAPGPWLVTTGALDRFACRWGQATIRYLKRDYQHPRWPHDDTPPPAVQRARDGQRGSKILVGGLSLVIEAWCDQQGVAAGAVATWVLRPARPVGEAWLRALTLLLNTATFSRIYINRHGAASMSGRQTTIKKEGLREMPIPPSFDEPHDSNLAWMAAMHDAIVAASGDRRRESEAHAHLALARLYGRSQEEAMDDYRWWCRQCRAEPLDEAALAAVLARWQGAI